MPQAETFSSAFGLECPAIAGGPAFGLPSYGLSQTRVRQEAGHFCDGGHNRPFLPVARAFRKSALMGARILGNPETEAFNSGSLTTSSTALVTWSSISEACRISTGSAP